MTGYTLDQAATAAGCTKQSIATWIHRDLVRTPLAKATAGHGRHYSWENIVEFAVLVLAHRLGAPASYPVDWLDDPKIGYIVWLPHQDRWDDGKGVPAYVECHGVIRLSLVRLRLCKALGRPYAQAL